MAKKDKLDALIMLSGDVLIQKNLDDFKNTDTSETKRPKTLDKRIKRTIAREELKNGFRKYHIPVKLIVASLLVVCTFSIASIPKVDAFGEYLWSSIVDFCKDFVGVAFDVKDQAAGTIEQKREPSVPEQWKKTVLCDNSKKYISSYSDNDTVILNFYQSTMTITTQRSDNEEVSIVDVTIGKYPGVFIKYTGKNRMSIKWSDEKYYYSITVYTKDFPVDELLDMAKSVYTKNK